MHTINLMHFGICALAMTLGSWILSRIISLLKEECKDYPSVSDAAVQAIWMLWGSVLFWLFFCWTI